jgi:hypothetical protein
MVRKRSRLFVSLGHIPEHDLFITICRPARGRDHRVGHDRGSRGLDRYLSGDRAQRDRGLHPSSPHSNVGRRGVAQAPSYGGRVQ